MIGHGAAPTHLASPTSTRPIARPRQPIAHLSGFSGVLQVDGYAGYRPLAKRNDVQLAFCWSHVRRRFYELAAAGPAPIATEALERIAKLYAVEKDIRGQTPTSAAPSVKNGAGRSLMTWNPGCAPSSP